jgi:antirestriction protein ArdC
MLRYYLVFNAEQVDGAVVPATETRTHQPIAEAEAMAAGYLAPTPGGPVLRHVAADGAFYAPAFDTIQLPPPEAFKSGEHYYLTLAHEMVHSTGHKSRLNRLDGAVARQGGSYAREELVAEIGAAMLAAHVGIESDGLIADSAAYIRHWRDTIAKDNGLVISAASRAEKAFHHIVKDVPENLAEAEREAEGGAA